MTSALMAVGGAKVPKSRDRRARSRSTLRTRRPQIHLTQIDPGSETGFGAPTDPLLTVRDPSSCVRLRRDLRAENSSQCSAEPLQNRSFIPKFAIVIGGTALVASLLHGIEAGIWAASYRLLGALPDNRTAMLYSLSAMTTYGHSNLYLEDHWQLMGALEALNGLLLFGLTTAFLFAMIQRVWPIGSRHPHERKQFD